MNAPRQTFLGDTYVFEWPAEAVRFTMERLHEARGGDLQAEVEIRCARDGVDSLLHHARLNILSTVGRQAIVKSLSARIPETEIDWGGAVEMACHLSLRQWREGDPVVDLRKVERQCGTRFLLEPFVERQGPTILFADGGTGKSMFAMAIAASIATGREIVGRYPSEQSPALYLDWESDSETHSDRLRAICAGMQIEFDDAIVLYRRQSASLAEAAPHIRRVIAEHHIGFVVVDSMGAARGGEPESADSTIRLFNAARSLNVPWLGVDHVTKNGGDGQPKPFGSVYTHNLARLTWGMEKVEDLGNGTVIVAVSNHKANNGRPLGRRGYEVTFREDADQRPTFVSYEPKEAQDLPGYISGLDQRGQIAEVIKRHRGAMLVEDIQTCLEADGVLIKAEQVRVVLNKHKNQFVAIPATGGTKKWGLLARDN